jgi:hypothetical protein
MKLLGLVINIPNYGCSEEHPKSLVSYCPKYGAACSSKTSANCTTAQPKEGNLHYHPFYLHTENL